MSIRILHCTAILIFVIASPLAAADLTCPSATTLDGLVSCIRDQMPGSGSNGFVFPSATQKTDWRWIVRQMLGGSCDFQPPASLSGIVKVRTFTDSGNGKSYCVLMEVQDSDGNGMVDRGCGTFILGSACGRPSKGMMRTPCILS